MDEKQGEYHADILRPEKEKSFQDSTRDKYKALYQVLLAMMQDLKATMLTLIGFGVKDVTFKENRKEVKRLLLKKNSM